MTRSKAFWILYGLIIDIFCAYDQVESVLNLVWSEFKSSLRDNTWMDEATKLTAIDKANSLVYKVGYPEFVKNVHELDTYYAQVL